MTRPLTLNFVEPKVVSARWRSLAHLHGQGLQDQQRLSRRLTLRLTDLYGFPMDRFESMVGEELSNLVNVTLGLHKMIYRDYVSGDIEPISPPPGSLFDSECMQVDDPRGNAPKAVDGPIFCTTSIGLVRTLMVRQRQGDDREDRLMLLKATILMNLDD